jgi:hypothetical protein
MFTPIHYSSFDPAFSPFGNLETQPQQFPMNPGRTPAWIGCSHPPDKITNFTIDLRPSRAFGFEFPEKFEPLAMPVDNSIRLYNDEKFAPRSQDSGKHNPEKPIH